MQSKKVDLLKKVRQELESEMGYVTAETLAKRCGTSIYRIYSSIRTLREGFAYERAGTNTVKPLGIHFTKKGYVLSEYASKTDDVEMFRRLNGARTSIYVTAYAAAPYIRPRWNSVADRSAFNLIISPFVSSGNALKQGRKLLVAKINIGKTKAGV